MPDFKIALVGEAYGEQEEAYKRPFVGPAGQELDRMLSDAGISRAECFVTSVFKFRPGRGSVETLCVGKREGGIIPGASALVKGKYLRSEYAGELARLYDELRSTRPNVCVALGSTATWALLRDARISKIRGTCSVSPVIPGLKVLPTYDPAGVLRQYDLRPVTVLDLQKAARQAAFPELRRPTRELWIDPTIEDIAEFFSRYVDTAEYLSFDVETFDRQITCISFAPSVDLAIVIPFTDQRKPKWNYWPDLQTELMAWDWVARYLATPAKKLGQNVLYDIQYLWMQYGIPVNNVADDTMLLHHSLHPESPKGLAFLGSVYTDEIAWKMLRPRGKHSVKREDA